MECERMKNDLEKRLLKAYFGRFRVSAQSNSTIEYFEDYAVLSNVNGILAVYKIENDQTLKYITPKWFETHILKKERKE
jgi:hypothetical protein